MNDLISRQVAIDAVLSIGHAAVLYDGDAVVRMSAINYVLRNLPSVQPDIIRCKDCKFYTKGRWRKRLGLCRAFDPDGYCAYAERRINETD